ncbi:MAG: hypothetical protein GY950_15240 [bacterium]|nr:hypothetical protein [bacterium]
MKKLIVLGFVVWFGLFFITVFGERIQEIKCSPLSVKTSDVHASEVVKRDLDFGKVPLYFIPNKGQVNEKARFYAKTARYTLWMTTEGLVFSSHSAGLRDVSRLLFRGANKNPGMEPVDVTPHTVNYYKGKNRHEGLRTSEGVVYKNIYNGIYLKVYGIEKELEYDWIINPKGNPQDIQFEYKNVKATHIDSAGNLVVKTAFGKMMHKRPVSYQVIKGVRVSVRSGFKKVGENSYAFDVGKYDKNRELVIDPVVTLEYSTYLGGRSGSDYGRSIAVDDEGYIYVTGHTNSSRFPDSNAYREFNSGGWDVFVTKFDPDGSGLFFSTFIGGSGSDYGNDIAVSKNGGVFIVGQTFGSDFPAAGAFKGGSNVFVVKFSYKGRYKAGRFFGGDRNDTGTAIAVDGSNDIFITGTTYSLNFPTKNAYQDSMHWPGSAFVCKLNPGNLKIKYSTFLGGAGEDFGKDIFVDDSGYFYVTGYTGSSNFPVKNAYQDTHGGDSHDAFISKFSPDGSGLVFSTYFGGTRNDYGTGIAVDDSGFVYVAGKDSGCVLGYSVFLPGWWPTRSNVFVGKFSPDGSELVFSFDLEGSARDESSGIALDSSDNIYIAGSTSSYNFPLEAPLRDTKHGTFDGFLSVIASDGSGLLYSSYIGGSDYDYCSAITIDDSGNVYLTGTTYSLNFPIKDPYIDHLKGAIAAFVSKFSFSFSSSEEADAEVSLNR